MTSPASAPGSRTTASVDVPAATGWSPAVRTTSTTLTGRSPDVGTDPRSPSGVTGATGMAPQPRSGRNHPSAWTYSRPCAVDTSSRPRSRSISTATHQPPEPATVGTPDGSSSPSARRNWMLSRCPVAMSEPANTSAAEAEANLPASSTTCAERPAESADPSGPVDESGRIADPFWGIGIRIASGGVGSWGLGSGSGDACGTGTSSGRISWTPKGCRP